MAITRSSGQLILPGRDGISVGAGSAWTAPNNRRNVAIHAQATGIFSFVWAGDASDTVKQLAVVQGIAYPYQVKSIPTSNAVGVEIVYNDR